ncbi:hypothetical protein MGI18_08070 [Bacillus sp. OVS6]|nr:hypothetical protein MGI18_08070 [Bacillus sp. OVS6]
MANEVTSGSTQDSNSDQKISYNTFIDLSIKVYENDNDDNIKYKNMCINVKGENGPEGWIVVDVIDDKETELQAMAVKKGNQIVIVYRGSQEFKDWLVDADYLVLRGDQEPSKTRLQLEIDKILTGDNYEIRKDLKNPFDEAVKFADRVKKEHPDAEFYTTGHSLGGALATYMRIKRWWWIKEAKTIAAPNVYGLLTDEEKAWVDKGAFKNNTEDITDPRDTFGELNSNFGVLTYFDRFPEVGTVKYVDNESYWTYFNHKSENFIRINETDAKDLAEKMDMLHSLTIDTQILLEDFSLLHDETILEVQREFEGRISSDFNLVPPVEVREIIEKYALNMSSGNPKFYDEYAEEELLSNINQLKKDTMDIADNIRNMAMNFKEKDNQIANWLKLD